MAEALYLVYKPLNNPANPLRDGVSALLINIDDGSSDAQIQAAAVTAANLCDGVTVPTGYFGDATVSKVSDLTTGIFKDNLDAMVFFGVGVPARSTSGI